MWDKKMILAKLKAMANPKAVEGMARFGINPKNTYGNSIPFLRKIAGEVKKDLKNVKDRHDLAAKLWVSGIHEAKILAGFIDVPELVSEKQMEKWVKDFDSWDVCDQVCSNLFDKTEFAYKKAAEWTRRKEEYVKRAGFVMMATLSVHDKYAKDEDFIKFFPLIKKESVDERNFVKKAVNWALRQIGKRNENLNKKAIKLAEEIKSAHWRTKSAKWIANDAIRELKAKNFKLRKNGKSL